MNTELARNILALQNKGARIVYGEATGTNTVALEGAATAVVLPALSPVASGDYCAVLVQGADRLILGAMATPWTAPTLLNSWTNYGAGFQACQYRRVGDVVQIRGLIQSGTSTIFTMPTGFRPPAILMFRQECATYKGCRVDVNTGGSVILSGYDTGGSNAYVSLDAITFSVS